MTSSRRFDATTADRSLPIRPRHAERQSALVVGYPCATALLVPTNETPVGRGWLESAGAEDAEVSSSHVVFRHKGTHVLVEDCGSRNGTWVDGEFLEAGRAVPLVDGSVLRMGRVVGVLRESLDRPLTASEPLSELVGPYGLHGVERAIQAMRESAPTTILIEGETGTGKELLAGHLARALRPERPYMAVNVAAVAQGVFESQLFGHVAGAFSGAKTASRGVLAAHDHGTVFLDEISALPISLQPKLLRVVENQEVLPVGADKPGRVDVLLLAATNGDLGEMVAAGTFRADLAARLGVWRLSLPPLRRRAEDLLAILRALAERIHRPMPLDEVEPEALERLMLEPWPTNVRGLLTMLAQLAEIDPEGGLHLWAVERTLGPMRDGPSGRLTTAKVRSALDAASGSEREAARRLGVSRGKLRRFRGSS